MQLCFIAFVAFFAPLALLRMAVKSKKRSKQRIALFYRRSCSARSEASKAEMRSPCEASLRLFIAFGLLASLLSLLRKGVASSPPCLPPSAGMQEEKQSFALLFFATLASPSAKRSKQAEGGKYKPGVARYEASGAKTPSQRC
jgi:hypothetical protein